MTLNFTDIYHTEKNLIEPVRFQFWRQVSSEVCRIANSNIGHKVNIQVSNNFKFVLSHIRLTFYTDFGKEKYTVYEINI